ncbi:glycosyltransferase [Iamia majanohamensis]|uniref:Glycosyltransferase n=1 Tax=Iamia majanohamensis TaxID=467976 RepID=A0AAE9Y7M2_9ACTN|nr:glycosyltransferase [Iamia majanohamensis]WCO68239.1 glycosyltransferase [Iamia majanohamensis]
MIASVRFSAGPPFAGGLEAHSWHLAAGLRARGHEVTLFGPEAPPGCRARPVPASWRPSAAARQDLSMLPDQVVADHHGYLQVVRDLARQDDFDVIHNNSAHYLPLASAPILRAPLVSTLHTPPTPWLESALALGGSEVGHLVSVSRSNAARWDVAQPVEVIPNGVDCATWRPHGGRRSGAVWTGRIVTEKAPHLAIAAARRCGTTIDLAGPVHDPTYFEEVIRPSLGPAVRYHGHLGQEACAELVASAEVSLVTPTWPEPFGLVVAESLACGTPVAGFAAGALPELVDEEVGRLVPEGDVAALARALPEAAALDAVTCRRVAEARFGLDRMVAAYDRTLAAQAS